MSSAIISSLEQDIMRDPIFVDRKWENLAGNHRIVAEFILSRTRKLGDESGSISPSQCLGLIMEAMALQERLAFDEAMHLHETWPNTSLIDGLTTQEQLLSIGEEQD